MMDFARRPLRSVRSAKWDGQLMAGPAKQQTHIPGWRERSTRRCTVNARTRRQFPSCLWRLHSRDCNICCWLRLDNSKSCGHIFRAYGFPCSLLLSFTPRRNLSSADQRAGVSKTDSQPELTGFSILLLFFFRNGFEQSLHFLGMLFLFGKNALH